MANRVSRITLHNGSHPTLIVSVRARAAGEAARGSRPHWRNVQVSPRAIGLLWEFPTSFSPFCASVQRHARDTEIDRTAARSRRCGASTARSAALSSTFIIVIIIINRLSLPAGSHERLHAPPAPRGAAYLWRRGAGCSVGSVREYHGSVPCGPNEARRAGCRATAPLPVGSGAASVSESRTEAGSRCKAAALQRLLFGSSFQRCAHELRQLHPELRPHRFTDYSSGITASVPPSLHRSALQSEPTSSQQSQQMLKT